MRFKERDTNVLYECKMIGDEVIVRLLPPNQHVMEKLSIFEFIKRFDESYV